MIPSTDGIASVADGVLRLSRAHVNCYLVIERDEIVLIEAADSAAAGRVKTALEARLEIKKNEMRDYLPDEYAVIAKCGVRQDGTLVAMIVSPDEKEISGAYQEGIR